MGNVVKRVSYIVTIPLALLAAVFAVANRQSATLDLWPLGISVNLPTYLIVLGALALGFFAGAFVAWTSSGVKRRRRLRESRHQADDLRREVARLKQAQTQFTGGQSSPAQRGVQKNFPTAS